MRTLIFIFLFYYSINYSSAQSSINDSSIFMPLLKLGYSNNFPTADLKNRVGYTSSLNVRLEIKLKNQFIVGGRYDFLFGNNFKDSGMLKDLANSDGQIINVNGQYGSYEMLQRGHHLGMYIGRLFPVFSPNPNSGIIVTAGLGLLAYRVNFNNISGDIVQFTSNYVAGYDRYTSGVSLTQYVGYRYMSKNKLMNFYGGIEFNQAYTKVRRDYQVDYEINDPRFGMRNDNFWNIQIGWILPIYKRSPKEFYY